MENICLSNKKPTIISIVASKSGTGKTTLIEALIGIFKSRKYTIGVLKHDAHKFDIDKKGKDSYRFTKAGADNVIISSLEKLAMVQILQEEKNLEEIIKLFCPLDIILIEGFKNNPYPKIEVHRRGIDNELLCKSGNTFIALASDEYLDINVPLLDLNKAINVADFIEKIIHIDKVN